MNAASFSTRLLLKLLNYQYNMFNINNNDLIFNPQMNITIFYLNTIKDNTNYQLDRF